MLQTIKRKLFGPPNGIELHNGTVVTRLSHINHFSYLRPRVFSKHLPLVMMFGEEHNVAGGCADCDGVSCVNAAHSQFFETLARTFGTVETPVDVYIEESYNLHVLHRKHPLPSSVLASLRSSSSSPSSLPSSSFLPSSSLVDVRRFLQTLKPEETPYHGILYRFEEFEELSRKYPGQIRVHANDARNLFPSVRVSEIIPTFLKHLGESIAHDSKFALLRKEMSKQVLNAVDGRPLTSLDVWMDVYALILDFSIPSSHLSNLSHLSRAALDVSLHAPLLDIYQLMRMFKKQCINRDKSCREIYSPLAVILTGAAHSRAIRHVLTTKGSPLHFYNAITSIDLPVDRKKHTYCIHIADNNVPLVNDWIEWVENTRDDEEDEDRDEDSDEGGGDRNKRYKVANAFGRKGRKVSRKGRKISKGKASRKTSRKVSKGRKASRKGRKVSKGKASRKTHKKVKNVRSRAKT